MQSVFEIIAEPNRRAILSLLVSSQQSVGEIERQLRMTQPSVSKHLRVLRDAGFVESTVDAQRRLYRLSSAGSGPLTWMLSNATSTAWINPRNHQPQRKGRLRRRRRGPNREPDKGETK
jgi:DNA-binding transcriptional ArsR family regulator